MMSSSLGQFGRPLSSTAGIARMRDSAPAVAQRTSTTINKRLRQKRLCTRGLANGRRAAPLRCQYDPAAWEEWMTRQPKEKSGRSTGTSVRDEAFAGHKPGLTEAV